jgi:hypothetical protein
MEELLLPNNSNNRQPPEVLVSLEDLLLLNNSNNRQLQGNLSVYGGAGAAQ